MARYLAHAEWWTDVSSSPFLTLFYSHLPMSLLYSIATCQRRRFKRQPWRSCRENPVATAYTYATSRPVRSPVTGAERACCSGAWDSLRWVFYKYLGRGSNMKRCVSNCHLNERPASWLGLLGMAKPTEMNKTSNPDSRHQALSPLNRWQVELRPEVCLRHPIGIIEASLWDCVKYFGNWSPFWGYTFYLARCGFSLPPLSFI